eukprot:1083201-Pleurochrysis_carterae.AAC.1
MQNRLTPIMLCTLQVCVWSEVYKKEFISQVQKAGYYWSLEQGSEGPYVTWRAGRDRALFLLSRETDGADYAKPFRLISRADHSAFEECAKCKRIRLEVAHLLRDGADSAAVATKKAEQCVHSDWFIKQRRELDTMRHSGGRHDTLFEQ